MNVAVTGGSGFIGQPLCQALMERGDKVTLLSRKQNHTATQVVYGDLTVASEALDSFVADSDVIYHCAGEIHNTELMYDLHVKGTANLLAAVQRKIRRTGTPIHWVQLSSTGAYGSQAGSQVVSESFNPMPVGEYEITKTISDELVMCMAASEPLMSYTIVRPSIVIGPTMPNQSVFQLADMVRRRLFFYIGDRHKNVSTYVHVTDVVRALVKCGNDSRAFGHIFIISNDSPQSDLMNAFAEWGGVTHPRLSFPEPFIRWLVRITSTFVKIPLTDDRINALVIKGGYDSAKIKAKLDFSFERTISESVPELLAGRNANARAKVGRTQ